MTEDQTTPAASYIGTDYAGTSGDIASRSVFRIISREENKAGTGFTHKSGNIITANHVVQNTSTPFILSTTGTLIESIVIARDIDLDLAILTPKATFSKNCLQISDQDNFNIGAQVSTWGFPGGYNGGIPLLSFGYLSSAIVAHKASGRTIEQWVVNAAFNSGNSGGPLIHIETGQVIGVVLSKLAPMSSDAMAALTALEHQQAGHQYIVTSPDGSTNSISEGQLVARLFHELRQQVQLVIGMAIMLRDLRNFLSMNGLTP